MTDYHEQAARSATDRGQNTIERELQHMDDLSGTINEMLTALHRRLDTVLMDEPDTDKKEPQLVEQAPNCKLLSILAERRRQMEAHMRGLGHLLERLVL